MSQGNDPKRQAGPLWPYGCLRHAVHFSPQSPMVTCHSQGADSHLPESSCSSRQFLLVILDLAISGLNHLLWASTQSADRAERSQTSRLWPVPEASDLTVVHTLHTSRELQVPSSTSQYFWLGDVLLKNWRKQLTQCLHKPH